MMWAFFLFGGMILPFALADLYYGVASKLWPSAIGQVVYSKAEGGRKARFTVNYVYSVGGRAFAGYRLSYGKYCNSRTLTKSYAQKYPTGKSVRVFYQPAYPERSVLEPGMRGGSIVILIVAVAFIGVGYAEAIRLGVCRWPKSL